MNSLRSPILAALITALWLWAPAVQLRAIPLWVFAGGGGGSSGGTVGTSPGTGNLLFWLDLEANGNDSSSNARNFTVNGTVTYTTAKAGNGVVLNSTDLLSISDAAWQTPADSFTIALWVNLADATPSTDSGILNKHNISSQRSILIRQLTDGTTAVSLSDTGTASEISLTSSGTRTDGTWFSLILVFTSATSATLYIDGSSQATTSTSIVNVHDSTASMQVGVYNSQYLAGTYDSVAMFNKAFTADEIAWYHNAGNGRAAADL